MDLDASRIVAELVRRDIPIGRPLSVMSVTTSTNDDAKRAAQGGAPSGAAFVADAQTRGRGRLGRSWYSPAGENLYASFVLRPSLDPKRAPLVTLASGLAVADAIAALAPDSRLALKWPNDVLIDDRKVAGILTEAHLGVDDGAWIVVGVGINVRTRTFPPDVRRPAASLALSGSPSVDRSDLFVELASALAHRIGALETGPPSVIVDAFVARDALLGRSITVDGSPAVAIGIAKDGALLVRRPDGTDLSCIAGDVRLKTSSDLQPDR